MCQCEALRVTKGLLKGESKVNYFKPIERERDKESWALEVIYRETLTRPVTK